MSVTPRIGSISGWGSSLSLRSWVNDRFLPVVMVVSTDDVENICISKNGLSLVDILRPFGEVTNINAPLRIGEQNIRIQELNLRFHYASTMDQPTAEVLDKYLKDVVEKSVAEDLQNLPTTLDGCLNAGPSCDLSPWFTKYREEFLRLLCFDAHETFDHALGCIFAISSTESDPLSAMDELRRSAPIPPLMAQEYMFPSQDEDFSKFFLIVHDGSKGGQTGLESAKEKLRVVQRVYGHNNCDLLLLNTAGGRKELQGVPPKPFESLRNQIIPGGGAGEPVSHPKAPEGGMGCWLSNGDMDRIKGIISSFVTGSLLPKLDIRIGKMSASLPLKKRSFAKLVDRTSSYLKMNFTGLSREQATAAGFKHYTLEAQGRQLGDIFFLLKRYEEAVDAYTSISVSREQYPKFYAGIQEMIGLCHAMIVGFGDPPLHFSKAYEYYQRVPGKLCRMLATRSAIVHSTYCISVRHFNSANQVLMKGYENEEMLRGALLLEQAALTLLQPNPPVLHKFAFQMTLAGVWFYNCLFRSLSFRCYELVLEQYMGKQWTSIEEHVGDMMLRFALEEGQVDSAIHWTQYMLSSNSHLSSEMQEQYLKSLSEYLSSLNASGEVRTLELSIPVVRLEELEVQVDEDYIVGSNLAQEADENVWLELEGMFQDAMSSSMTTTGMGSMSSLLGELFNNAICGEAISLVCKFHNPLSVAIQVDEVKVLYEYERGEGPQCAGLDAPVTIREESFKLKGEETAVVRLEVQPNVPGQLRIIGLAWRVNGVILGQKLFKQDAVEQTNRLPFRAKTRSPCLLFLVSPQLPRLECESTATPDDMWVGEVWDGTWTLKNASTVGFRNLQVATSTSSLLFCKAGNTEEFADSVEPLPKAQNGYLLHDEDVQGGTRLYCPVWLHPSSPGQHVMHCLFRYECIDVRGPMRWRMLRYSFGLKVQAALKLTHELKQTQGCSLMYRMSMNVENSHITSSVLLQSECCFSQGWSIVSPEDLQGEGSKSVDIDQTVPPNHKAKVHALLKPPPCLETGAQRISEGKNEDENQDGADDAPLQLLQRQRIATAAQCSTSGAKVVSDCMQLCLSWCVPGTESPVKARRKRSRWGMLYCIQELEGVLQPIHVSAHGTVNVKHKFSDSRACNVPFVVTVQNGSSTSASIRIEAGSQFEHKGGGWKGKEQGSTDVSKGGGNNGQDSDGNDSNSEATVLGLSPASSSVWTGQTRVSVPELPAGSAVSLPLSVLVLNPGVYEIRDYLCSWTLEGSPTVHGTTNGTPVFLTVEDEG